MGRIEDKENKEQTSPQATWIFGRAVKAFVLADAAMVLFLCLGFALPSKPVHDSETGALPESFYDYSAKISPFTPPAPEPAHAKVDVEKITARGDHPTFVPVQSDPVLNAYANSDVQTFDPNFGATATHASYSESDNDSDQVPTVEMRATARELPAAIKLPNPTAIARPAAASEPPAAAPAGARVETVSERRTT